MKHATLCFILDGDPPARILLGRKKRGFGLNKLNGFGGKIQPGETVPEAAVREIERRRGTLGEDLEVEVTEALAMLQGVEP